MSSKFYITTPIYYVNDVPHIGHAYTTIISDALARYHRMRGKDVYFLTGTDEHGQKIEQSAKNKNKSPEEYVNEISVEFRNLWDRFDITYDKFIRTTDIEHKNSVRNIFSIMFSNGDIYKGEYEGSYCISCESFVLNSAKCPDCNRELISLKEESYFFRLSAYEDRLLKFYDENPEFILPISKRKEIINFVKNGLEDLSITRTSFKWGISIPDELKNNDSKDHIIYVWLDALINYLSAVGYKNSLEDRIDFFPPQIQLVGKDILKFHAIYWPAFLMSLGLPLPKHIATHGWWTKDGAKMSKSIGNVINPAEVVDEFGLDSFRYFLLREVPFGNDGDFSKKAMIDRINADLSNDLGNLLNRLIGMSGKYFSNNISSINDLCDYQVELESVYNYISESMDSIEKVEMHLYLDNLWKIFDIANLAITKKEPWNLVKENRNSEVADLLVFVANVLIKGAYMIYPCMPDAALKILSVFGLEIKDFDRYIIKKELLLNIAISSISQLFPRVEYKAEEVSVKNNVPAKSKVEPLDIENPIDREYFMNINIKVGTIVEAEVLPKSEKLLRLKVDLGENRPRQIIAGIKQYYEPSALVGIQVCVLANLKPAKLMGELSEGMILAAKDESGLTLIAPKDSMTNGSNIS